MLVYADAIDAAVRSVNKFIEGPIVVLANLGRIGELPIGRVDPHRVVAFLEVRRQIAIRHQVEHRYFHFTASAGSTPDMFFQYHEPHATPNALLNPLGDFGWTGRLLQATIRGHAGMVHRSAVRHVHSLGGEQSAGMGAVVATGRGYRRAAAGASGFGG